MMTDPVRSGSIAPFKSREQQCVFLMNDNKENRANRAQTPEPPDKNNNDEFQDNV
jgi:hypothetical protein